jgi:hypothetical protein
MDSSFINTLSDNELIRITPTIFDTLQKIIQKQDNHLKSYQQLAPSCGSTIDSSDIIVLLQSSLELSQSGTVIVEKEGMLGQFFYILMPQDILNLLGIPLNQCHSIHLSGQTIVISAPAQRVTDWDIISIPFNNQK